MPQSTARFRRVLALFLLLCAPLPFATTTPEQWKLFPAMRLFAMLSHGGMNPPHSACLKARWRTVSVPSTSQSLEITGHEIRLYRNDAAFVDGFARSLATALINENVVIIVPTESQPAGIFQKLRSDGVDVATAIGNARSRWMLPTRTRHSWLTARLTGMDLPRSCLMQWEKPCERRSNSISVPQLVERARRPCGYKAKSKR